MEHDKDLISRLNASLCKGATIISLARWLMLMPSKDLISLALIALNGEGDGRLKGITRALMAAEGLYRPHLKNEATYIHRLGWHALAEYASRKEWVHVSANPTLTSDARETTTITTIGFVMMSAMGPSSKIVSLISQCLKTDQTH